MGKKSPRDPPKTTAIKVGAGVNVTLKNVSFSGSQIGLHAGPGASITATDLTFDRVETPYDLEGVKSATIRGTRITNDPKQSSTTRSKTPGWRKLNGPPLPAFCPQCKSIFPSRNYNLSGAYFNTWDNEETCPECGFEHAKLSEGVFNLEEETVRVLSAPDFTYAMLQQAKRVADEIIAGNIDEKDGARAFGAISPKFTDLISKAPGFLYKAIALIATVVAAYYAYMQYEHPKADCVAPLGSGAIHFSWFCE